MNNFKTISSQTKKLGKTSSRSTLTVGNDDDTPMNINDVKTLITSINDQITTSKKYSYKYTVVVKTPLNNYFTIKGFADTDIKYDDIDEYLNGRVKDTTKFGEIYTVTITMHKQKL